LLQHTKGIDVSYVSGYISMGYTMSEKRYFTSESNEQ